MKWLVLVGFIALSASALAEQRCERISVSANPNYPPFHWEQDGKLVGASIDVTVKILKDMGIEPVVAFEGPWKRVLRKAELGQVDLIPALKLTEQRASYLEFTQAPFFSNPVAVFVRADSKRNISTLRDLNGLHGSLSLGDKHGKAIDEFLQSQNDNIHRVIDISSNFEMLKRGRTDYFIHGLYSGKNYLKHEGLQANFKVAQVFDVNWVHHGFSKRSKCLHIREEFDRRLSELLNSGYIGRVVEQYSAL